MEITLFSECIKELICDFERVAIPNFGVFSTEQMPAYYSDNLTTINPPYRKLSFRRREISVDEGHLFLAKISERLNVDEAQAEVEANWCISRLSSELESNKICRLPGLGKMKADSKNDFFFVPDDTLDISPEGQSLEAICIKVSNVPSVQTPMVSEDDTISYGGSAEMYEPAVEDSVIEDTGGEKAPFYGVYDEQSKFEPETVGSASGTKGVNVLLTVLLIFLILVLAGLVFSYLSPLSFSDMLDAILYTPEELEILGK